MDTGQFPANRLQRLSVLRAARHLALSPHLDSCKQGLYHTTQPALPQLKSSVMSIPREPRQRMASLSPTPGPTSLAPPLFPDVSLCDLRKHSSDQEARIRQLNYGFDSETTICALWTEFRAELWGRKPVSFQKEEPVEIDDPDPIPNVKLPDTHCLATLPKALPSMWGIRSQRILVRSEYSEAEREAISASTRQYCKMFIVAGQLGVGTLTPPPFFHRPQKLTFNQGSPCFYSCFSCADWRIGSPPCYRSTLTP